APSWPRKASPVSTDVTKVTWVTLVIHCRATDVGIGHRPIDRGRAEGALDCQHYWRGLGPRLMDREFSARERQVGDILRPLGIGATRRPRDRRCGRLRR